MSCYICHGTGCYLCRRKEAESTVADLRAQLDAARGEVERIKARLSDNDKEFGGLEFARIAAESRAKRYRRRAFAMRKRVRDLRRNWDDCHDMNERVTASLRASLATAVAERDEARRIAIRFAAEVQAFGSREDEVDDINAALAWDLVAGAWVKP